MTGIEKEGKKGESETQRLYYFNAYQVCFEAKIIARGEWEGKPALMLEATCFYPEGGGQPCDLGEIEGVRVIKVIEQDGRIWHLLEKEISAEKKRVKGKIDWARRFDHMQQHSGQHLLSQVCWEKKKAETLSFHLGEESSSIELDVAHLTEEEEKLIEQRVAELIYKNLPIKTYFVSEQEAASIPFRKKPAKTGLLRVVEIEDYDFSACGGTHVGSTGEIGLIKIIGRERIRQHFRLFFLCGERARQDYQKKSQILERLAASLSSSLDQVGVAVERFQVEAKSLRKKCRRLREKLNEYEAKQILAETEGEVITRLWDDRSAQEARELALKIIHQGKALVLFGVRGETQDYLILARSEGIPLNLTSWLPFLRETLQGKGGGRESLVEIVCPKGASLEKVIEVLREKYASIG